MSYEGFENEKMGLIEKRNYLTPQLICYGAVRDLTQGGTGQSSENVNECSNITKKPNIQCSDRRAKENIFFINRHSLGIGLYLFDYKPEFRDAWGHGRQFGVMADEIETVMPEAVSVHPDGYKMVNYAMLGISRNLH